MNKKAQVSLLIESLILIITLILLGIFWGSFSSSTFLAGMLKVEDARLRHYCSSFMPVLLANEYIKSGPEELTAAVEGLNELLNITDPRLYPSPDYLKLKISTLYGTRGPQLAAKTGIRVFNGTVISENKTGIGIDLFSLLGISASRGQLATCGFPIYGPEYSGYINMTVII